MNAGTAGGWQGWSGAGAGGQMTSGGPATAVAGGVPPPPPTNQPVREQGPGVTGRTGVLEVATANGGVIKLEGEYEEYFDGGMTVNRRIKEQDKVIAPKCPHITAVNEWHNQQARNLVHASGLIVACWRRR